METATAAFNDLHRYSAQQSANDASPYFASAYNAPQEAIDPSLQSHNPSSVPPLDDDDAASSIGASPVDGHNIAVDSNGQPLPSNGEIRKRPRACDSCRQLKVACKLDEGQPCKRCKKANRTCIITPPARTRKRKGPDSNRISELERKVEQLNALLATNAHATSYSDGYPASVVHAAAAYETSPPQPNYQPDPRLLGGPVEQSRRHESYPPQQFHSPERSPHKRQKLEHSAEPSHELRSHFDGHQGGESTSSPPFRFSESMTKRKKQAIDHTDQPGEIYDDRKPAVFDHSDLEVRIVDIIGWASAETLFDRYKKEFVSVFGAVPIPEKTSAYNFLRSKPILFLAIISSTSFAANVPAEAQNQLADLLRGVLGEAIWKNGEKSLEIVQAIQVACLWYRPPLNFEQHMFYEMIHFSAVMLLDMGFGKRLLNTKPKLNNESPHTARRFALIDSVEGKRAWLVSYFLCVSINMVLRRPMLIRFNEYMEDLVEFFETSKAARPSDRTLCQHVKVGRILEDIANQFRLDDPSANITWSDEKVEVLIKNFERELVALKLLESNEPTLHLAQYTTSLYIHEIALHHHVNWENFKNPFTEETFKASTSQTVSGRSHAECIVACKHACVETLRIFLDFSSNLLYMMPVHFTVRVIYSTVILIKLYVAATSGSELGAFINKDELRVEHHINGLISRFSEVLVKDPESPHKKFLMIMQRLKHKYEKYVSGDLEEIKPLAFQTGSSNTQTRPSSTTSSVLGGPSSSSQRQPDQGLHLLSEAAGMGNQQQNPGPMGQAHHQHPPTAQWYQTVEAPDVATMMNHPIATQQMVFHNPNGQIPSGYETYDYVSNRMGYDMDMRGLIGGEGLWGLADPFAGINGYNGMPF